MAVTKHPDGYMPGYFEFFGLNYEALNEYLSRTNCSGNWIALWLEDLKAHAYYSNCDVVLIVLLAILWTLLRILATRQIFKVCFGKK